MPDRLEVFRGGIPLGGPAQVLDYLARYTNRTALSNERIVGMDDANVALRVRADAHGGKRNFMQRVAHHDLLQCPRCPAGRGCPPLR